MVIPHILVRGLKKAHSRPDADSQRRNRKVHFDEGEAGNRLVSWAPVRLPLGEFWHLL